MTHDKTVAVNGLALAVLGCLMLLIGGCSSAKITNTWRDRNFAGPIQFKKTVALAIHPDTTVRRVAEDEMVRQMGEQRAVAAYNLLDEDDRQDINRMKSKFQAAGVDGAVTLQLLGKRSETTYVPGSPSYGFYDYYGGARYAGSPGYVVTDEIATVETRIYSVSEGKLIWSATSETFNPSDIRANIADIAKAVGEELRKEKLLVSTSK
jgi:hypothetical protein